MNDVGRTRLTELHEAAVISHASARWRPYLYALAALLLAFAVIYWSTAVSIVEIWWRSETFTHGFLIVPISLYMIWTRRRTLAHLSPIADARGACAVALLGLAWLLGNAAHVLVVQQLAFVALIPAVVFALFGAQVSRALMFPLAYLLFAVPFGEFLVPPLMDWTAWFSVKAIQLTGVPVFREGRYIALPTGGWEVAEACSGIRYLIASLAVGCLYAYLSYRECWRRIAFITLAALLPIVANGLRAYGIIMLGHLSDMRIAAGVDHVFYGWVFFGVVILLLFWVGSLWREPQAAVDSSERRAVPPATGTPPRGRTAGSSLCAACVGILLVGSAAPGAAAWIDAERQQRPQFTLRLPDSIGRWSSAEAVHGTWKPRFPPGDLRIHQAYADEGRIVELLVVHYARQQQGRELVSSQNRVYDGERWRRTDERRTSVRLPGVSPLTVHETLLDSTQGRRLVWHWYDIAGHRTASPWVAKLWEAWGKLSGNRGSTLVMLAADYDLHAGDARESLHSFLADAPWLHDLRNAMERDE